MNVNDRTPGNVNTQQVKFVINDKQSSSKLNDSNHKSTQKKSNEHSRSNRQKNENQDNSLSFQRRSFTYKDNNYHQFTPSRVYDANTNPEKQQVKSPKFLKMRTRFIDKLLDQNTDQSESNSSKSKSSSILQKQIKKPKKIKKVKPDLQDTSKLLLMSQYRPSTHLTTSLNDRLQQLNKKYENPPEATKQNRKNSNLKSKLYSLVAQNPKIRRTDIHSSLAAQPTRPIISAYQQELLKTQWCRRQEGPSQMVSAGKGSVPRGDGVQEMKVVERPVEGAQKVRRSVKGRQVRMRRQRQFQKSRDTVIYDSARFASAGNQSSGAEEQNIQKNQQKMSNLNHPSALSNDRFIDQNALICDNFSPQNNSKDDDSQAKIAMTEQSQIYQRKAKSRNLRIKINDLVSKKKNKIAARAKFEISLPTEQMQKSQSISSEHYIQTQASTKLMTNQLNMKSSANLSTKHRNEASQLDKTLLNQESNLQNSSQSQMNRFPPQLQNRQQMDDRALKPRPISALDNLNMSNRPIMAQRIRAGGLQTTKTHQRIKILSIFKPQNRNRFSSNKLLVASNSKYQSGRQELENDSQLFTKESKLSLNSIQHNLNTEQPQLYSQMSFNTNVKQLCQQIKQSQIEREDQQREFMTQIDQQFAKMVKRATGSQREPRTKKLRNQRIFSSNGNMWTNTKVINSDLDFIINKNATTRAWDLSGQVSIDKFDQLNDDAIVRLHRY